MDNKYYIYKIINKNSKEILYIGKTIDINNRLFQHSKDKIWVTENVEFEVAELNSRYEMDIYEIYYIGIYKPIYNIQFVYEEEIPIKLPNIEFYNYKFNYRKGELKSNNVVMINYKKILELNDTIITNNIFRIVYLGATSNGKGSLIKISLYRGSINKKLIDILQTSPRIANPLISKLFEYNILINNGEDIYLNPNFISKTLFKNKEYIKINANIIKNIYINNLKQKFAIFNSLIKLCYIYKINNYDNMNIYFISGVFNSLEKTSNTIEIIKRINDTSNDNILLLNNNTISISDKFLQ